MNLSALKINKLLSMQPPEQEFSVYLIACHYQKAVNDSRVQKLPAKDIITADIIII